MIWMVVIRDSGDKKKILVAFLLCWNMMLEFLIWIHGWYLLKFVAFVIRDGAQES